MKTVKQVREETLEKRIATFEKQIEENKQQLHRMIEDGEYDMMQPAIEIILKLEKQINLIASGRDE